MEDGKEERKLKILQEKWNYKAEILLKKRVRAENKNLRGGFEFLILFLFFELLFKSLFCFSSLSALYDPILAQLRRVAVPR